MVTTVYWLISKEIGDVKWWIWAVPLIHFLFLFSWHCATRVFSQMVLEANLQANGSDIKPDIILFHLLNIQQVMYISTTIFYKSINLFESR